MDEFERLDRMNVHLHREYAKLEAWYNVAKSNGNKQLAASCFQSMQEVLKQIRENARRMNNILHG